jgi:hypothetical protein
MRTLPVWAALLACAAVGLVSAAAAPGFAHPLNAAQHTALTPRSRTRTGTPSPPVAPKPPPTTTLTTVPPSPAPAPVNSAVVAADVVRAAQGVVPSAQIGFEVFDRQTGAVLADRNPGQQFPAMSVVKLLIALDALRADNWALPDAGTSQELRQMLSASDDGVADALWGTDGGPDMVTRMAGLMGLTGTQPPEDPGEWGDTLITAQDMVTVYRYVTERLPAADRDFVVGALAAAPRVASDGSDQYFGIPDGLPNTTWAIKQGWGTSGDLAVMDSTGLVGPAQRYVTVLLASASAGTYGTLPQAVTAAAGALTTVVGAPAAGP